MLAALAAPAPAEPPPPRADACAVAPLANLPRIGERWPGVDGTYAGLSRGEDGQPDAHLVLLDAEPDCTLNWKAAIEWAHDQGEGARLPTRFESALLYAHLREKFDASQWYWTGTQYSAGDAWDQNFNDGNQSSNDKKYEARARAVRRFAA